MIIQRLSKGIKDQDWFVVMIEVLIVVVGIFIGLQVDDWSEEQAFYQSETELLYELRREIEASVRLTNGRLDSYKQVTDAGRRSLNFISSGVSCDPECWPILVDFFHASQWQGLSVQRSTYDKMRLRGMPRNVAIFEAVETYLQESRVNSEFYERLPYYRSLVRRLIPLEIQEYYWEHCYSSKNDIEVYKLDCPKAIADGLTFQTVEDIVSNSEIKTHLTEWIGGLMDTPKSLGRQKNAALHAITVIDADLEHRQ